jgi:hypothetical protein
LTSVNRVEDVLMRHIYRDPICDNIIRMNDFLTFEHEAKLPNGSWLLIIYRYDPKSGLTANRIFNRYKFDDLTKEYKNHPYVASVMRLIEEEIKASEK